LDPSKSHLAIREHPQRGIYVERLSEHVVGDVDDVMNLLKSGVERIHYSATMMNLMSSRAFAVFMITVRRDVVQEEHDASLQESGVFFPEDELSFSLGSPMRMSGQYDPEKDVLTSRFTFYDLCGSERLKKTHSEGDRLVEARHIKYAICATSTTFCSCPFPSLVLFF
jgi:hypothetical protein